MKLAVLALHITAADACWPTAGHDAVHITNTCAQFMQIRLYTFADWSQTVRMAIPKHAIPKLTFVTKQCRLCCQSSTKPVLVLGFTSIHV